MNHQKNLHIELVPRHDNNGVLKLYLYVMQNTIVECFEDNASGRTELFSKYSRENMVNNRWCGIKDCGCSTGIHDGLTFGRGELSGNGFWEIPCRVCAIAHDAEQKERIQQLKEEAKERGLSFQEEQNKDPGLYEWATSPAWPFE